jgi:hypothetical protein
MLITNAHQLADIINHIDIAIIYTFHKLLFNSLLYIDKRIKF